MKRNLGENTKVARALIVAATLAVLPSCAKPTRIGSAADTGRFCAAGKYGEGCSNNQRSSYLRVLAKIAFHECKLLIEKRIRTCRWRVHFARSPGGSKTWPPRRSHFHKLFPQKLWKRVVRSKSANVFADYLV